MDKLKEFLKNEKIEYSQSDKDININSEDTSLFKITPEIIIYPKSRFEISELLKFVNENKEGKYNIVSRSAGTDMSGGVLGNSIILSMTKYFKNIIRIDKDNLKAIVEPGVYYRDFEMETLKHNLLLPSYPASREICTVGGMVANNSGGEKSLIYGKTEQYIEELECVLANGEIVNFKALEEDEFKDKLDSLDQKSLEYSIYRNIWNLVNEKNNKLIIDRNKPKVSKNSAGYYLWNILKVNNKGERFFDLTRLITGSQGTIAIITKIKFKLISPKSKSIMLLTFLKDLKNLGKVRELILKGKPESFESYDNQTFKVAIKFLPAFLKKIFIRNKEEKSKVSFLRLIFSFWREIYMLLTFGMPKLFLITEFTGDEEEEILKRVEKVKESLENNFKNKQIKSRVIKTDFEKEKYWTMRRESFNLLRQRVRGYHTAPFIDDIIVRGEKLEEFLIELIPILNKYKLLYTIAGHVGDGNLHIIPLMNFDKQGAVEKDIQIIRDCSKEVYNLIHKFNGSITAEHNDGLIRTPFLFEMYDREMLKMFKEVKNIFDEKNILNPNKKVPITDDFSKEFENNLKYLKFGR